jgi:hypothetical protein
MAQWPHEEVQESGKLYPETLLRVKVTKQEDMEDNSGRFAVQIDSRIMEPPSLKNQPYSFRFIIGMTADTAQKFGLEEDLLAEEEATWINNPSARRYKSFLKACGVASTGDTEEEAEDVRGKVLLIQNGNREGKYNDASAFYPEGEGHAALDDERSQTLSKRGRPAQAAASQPQTTSKKKKEQVEVVEEGEWDD